VKSYHWLSIETPKAPSLTFYRLVLT